MFWLVAPHLGHCILLAIWAKSHGPYKVMHQILPAPTELNALLVTVSVPLL